MSDLRSLVRTRLEALLVEVAECGLGDEDLVGRVVLQEVTGRWLARRSLEDVRGELSFVLENLDPETDFTFMRP